MLCYFWHRWFNTYFNYIFSLLAPFRKSPGDDLNTLSLSTLTLTFIQMICHVNPDTSVTTLSSYSTDIDSPMGIECVRNQQLSSIGSFIRSSLIVFDRGSFLPIFDFLPCFIRIVLYLTIMPYLFYLQTNFPPLVFFSSFLLTRMEKKIWPLYWHCRSRRKLSFFQLFW